jgi:hypothetical protein
MNDSIGTETDPAAHEWAITDRVIQLRRWGTDVVYPLPEVSTYEPTLGSGDACSLQLSDPSGQISRRHARLVWKATN